MLIFLDKYFLKAELVDFTVEKIVLFTAYLFEEGKSPNTISICTLVVGCNCGI
jgi:hypothetical protein